MNKGTAGAIGLILLWVAFACFFIAFHPGGLIMPNGKAARNPRDVIVWLMQRFAMPAAQAQQSDTAPSPTDTGPQTE